MIKQTLIILLLSTTALHAGIHRWVDEQGHVHYSDQPPTKQKSEEIKLQINNIKPDPHTQERLYRQQQQLESFQQDREDQKTQQLADKKDAEQQLKACKKAQEQLNIALNSGRLFTVDEKGNRSYMDDSQRQSYIEQGREAVKTHCK